MIDVSPLPKSLRDDIRQLHTPHGRRRHQQCLVEGVRACEDVGASAVSPHYVVVHTDVSDRTWRVAEALRRMGAEVFMATSKVMNQLADTKTPQDILAVVSLPRIRPLGSRVLVLDRVSDPGNAGTLIRTAAWFGCSDVVFTSGSVDPYSPKIVRSSVASLFGVGIHQPEDAVNWLQGIPHTIVAAVAQGGDLPSSIDVTPPFALVLGSEAHGIDARILNLVHKTTTIKQASNVESLNVAVAGAILLYEWFGR